jgi:hypothetical protein
MEQKTDQGNFQEQDWHPRMEVEANVREGRNVGEGRGFPVWIWGCGGCALLVLVMFVGGMVWIGNVAYTAFGPEAAWPALAEVLPYGEQRPEGYQPMLVDAANLEKLLKRMPGFSDEDLADLDIPVDQQIYLQRLTGVDDQEIDTTLGAAIYVFPADTPLERRHEILHQHATELSAGGAEVEELRQVEITFQGRTTAAIRFAGINDFQNSWREVDGPLEILEIDLSGGRQRPVVLHFSGSEQPTEAELEEFFAPFDVWGGK